MHAAVRPENDVVAYLQSYRNKNMEAETFLRSCNLTDFINQTNFPRKIENLLQEFSSLQPLGLDEPNRFDVVHQTYFANLNCKKARLVSTVHDVIPIEAPQLFNKMNGFFSKKNLKRQILLSDAIIAVSKYTKDRILAHYDVCESKIHVLPLGIGSEVLKFSCPTTRSKNFNYFLSIGNIEPRKNHLTAARAIAKLNRKLNADFKYIVVGRELFQSDRIVAQLREVLGENLVVTGFLSNSDKLNWLSNATAHIFPSSYEGFGLPALESYHLKIPTLLANNSSLTELAVDAWQLFDTFSSDELFGKLDDIASKASPSALVNAQLDFSKHCSWDVHVNQAFKIYSSLR